MSLEKLLHIAEIDKTLRQNPIGNQAISTSSGQQPSVRIILSILQSFLDFLQAKDIAICLK